MAHSKQVAVHFRIANLVELSHDWNTEACSRLPGVGDLPNISSWFWVRSSFKDKVFRNMSFGSRLFRLLMFTRKKPRILLAWKCKYHDTQNWCEQAMIEVFQRRLHTRRQSQEAMINYRRSDACHTTRQDSPKDSQASCKVLQ
jgi:hypothetical protein